MENQKKYKIAKHIIPSLDIQMGGEIIKQALPNSTVNQVDPFLLLHHINIKHPKDSNASHLGIAPHPHRGFSPITFVINGDIHHKDSRGNDQIAKKGEVQWMHSGFGIIHSERPTQDLVDHNGTQEIIQLWVNSPAQSKMNPPNYQYLNRENIPIFYSDDKQIKNKLIAGEYMGLKGKAITESELLIIWGKAKSKSSQVLQMPKTHNTSLYVIKGKINIPEYGIVTKENLIVFQNNVDELEISIDADTEFLLLSGIPINEKIAQQGPFVMNTQTEILEAMRDYRMGKMGVLIE